MSKKRVLIFTMAFIMVLAIFLIAANQGREKNINTLIYHRGDSISLSRGDIIVRPNNPHLPGSAYIKGGRRLGHVAVVVKGASGNSAEQVLSKSIVIEALLYDQKTKSFIFDTCEQVRYAPASFSFGSKYRGCRYRLRLNTDVKKIDSIVEFLESQLDGSYSIFTEKIRSAGMLHRHSEWHCATLAWQACYAASGVDIDGNGGSVIYPSDIIISTAFDHPGGRVIF
ncbi:MAG: hypothetical protein PHT25_10055 [Bacteroidales bacterium]|jgi:hypothetical protein|nr:hypothetical protein [Bacteroidales bacterium]